jgi:hypothetical protein
VVEIFVESLQAEIVRARSDMPPTVARFLFGIPFDPPRAGMIAIAEGFMGLISTSW